MVPVAWGAMMGWVGWRRYSGGGGAGLSAIISGLAIQEPRERRRGGRCKSGTESGKETWYLCTEGWARDGGESNSDWMDHVVVGEVKGWKRCRRWNKHGLSVFIQQPPVENYPHTEYMSPALQRLAWNLSNFSMLGIKRVIALNVYKSY